MRFFILIVFFANSILQISNAFAGVDDRIPVEIAQSGSDPLTLAFSKALESAFRESSRFNLSKGKRPGTLMVIIPGSVWHSNFGNEIEVKAFVNLTTVSSEPVGTVIPVCFEGRLSVCANRVVEYASSFGVGAIGAH